MHSHARITLALPALGGCTTRLTGNEGNFVFSYLSDDDVTNFNKPIAVGARLDIEVREVGTNLPVELLDATYDDTSVLDVADFADYTVVAEGMGDGGALLSVEASTDGGEVLTDSVNMLAATPEVLKLGHTCTTDATAAYMTDQRVWVPFEMEKENGQPVIGYGYYPLSVDGSAVNLDAGDSGQVYIAFDTSTTAAQATLESDVDDTTLAIEVHAPSAIDGVQEPIAFVAEDIDVGDVNAFYVRPTVGALVTCQADVTKAVASLTPEICDVRDSDNAAAGGDEQHEFGWFEIEGVAAGTCQYTVTFPDGDGGNGVTATFEYPIEP